MADTFQRLSILIPVFNEATTVEEILRRVRAADSCGLEKEIVLVDDASTDGTSDVLKKLQQGPGVKVVAHPFNRGKGAALRTALEHATGDIVLIQDADLEYDPSDYPRLLRPILDRSRGRGLWLAVRGRDTPRLALLALHGQPPPHAPVEHALQSQPHRHGNLLQGLPPPVRRGHQARRPTASASNPN